MSKKALIWFVIGLILFVGIMLVAKLPLYFLDWQLAPKIKP